MEKDFNRIDEINWTPELPISISPFLQEMSSALSNSNTIYDRFKPLENKDDIAMKLFCSYLK